MACNADAHDEIIGYWKHHKYTQDTFIIEITENSYKWSNRNISNSTFTKKDGIWLGKELEFMGRYFNDAFKPIDKNTIEVFQIFGDKQESKGKYIRITKETYDDIMKNHKGF